MSDDTNPPTNPVSEVNNRVLPARHVRRARSADAGARLAHARRSLASLAAAAENPPLSQRASFNVDGLGPINTRVLANFNLADEKADGRSGFTLTYEYRGSDVLRHKTASEVAHNALRKALYAHGLAFRSAAAATVYKIEVDAVVPAYVSVIAPDDAAKLALTLHNVARLGTTTFDVAADKLDRRLVDAIVELISSGGGDFYSLVR
ncbi:MAG: hypothetical protein ACU85V_07450 [Gammaproteobacteria bacterium]